MEKNYSEGKTPQGRWSEKNQDPKGRHLPKYSIGTDFSNPNDTEYLMEAQSFDPEIDSDQTLDLVEFMRRNQGL